MSDPRLVNLASKISRDLFDSGLGSMQFVLVVWKPDDDTPAFSSSSEMDFEIVVNMLQASIEQIRAIELYADENAGHA